jgi:hypothetical protein
VSGKVTVKRLQERLARPATLIDIVKGPPAPIPSASWFGRVNLRLPHESWPIDSGGAMLPIAQLDLREAPFVPPALRDIEVITVFFGRGALPSDAENGNGWLVRAYPDASALFALDAPERILHAHSEWSASEPPIKPRPIAYRAIERDFPDWDDVALEMEIPEELEESWEEHFGATRGCKLGGWPSLIQSEIFWSPDNLHPANPEYVLQLESVPKANVTFFADSVCHVGRGTGDARDAWSFAWQCD